MKHPVEVAQLKHMLLRGKTKLAKEAMFQCNVEVNDHRISMEEERDCEEIEFSYIVHGYRITESMKIEKIEEEQK